MTTMFSKLFLAGVFSTVLAAALSPLASASIAPIRSTVSASGSAARVYAEDEKKKDDKKSKSEGKADSKKGGDKKPAPSGGW
jgi:hypothetical protein